jgi:hypothetical protein
MPSIASKTIIFPRVAIDSEHSKATDGEQSSRKNAHRSDQDDESK